MVGRQDFSSMAMLLLLCSKVEYEWFHADCILLWVQLYSVLCVVPSSWIRGLEGIACICQENLSRNQM